VPSTPTHPPAQCPTATRQHDTDCPLAMYTAFMASIVQRHQLPRDSTLIESREFFSFTSLQRFRFFVCVCLSVVRRHFGESIIYAVHSTSSQCYAAHCRVFIGSEVGLPCYLCPSHRKFTTDSIQVRNVDTVSALHLKHS